MEFSDQLEEVMTSRNFFLKGKINYSLTGKFQRFPDSSKNKRKKDLFVVLHDYDRGATFGNWHYPDDWFTHWNKNYENPGLSEIRILKSAMEESKKIQQYERSKHEWRAREFWNKYYVVSHELNHSYVTKKKIIPFYARQYRTKLLIPVSDIDFNMKTIQIIKLDGFKRLWKGTSQTNNMMWLCEKLPQHYSGIIRVCEGYATGCTIRQITNSPVVCAINSLNLIRVSILLKRKFIHSQIKICADNDKWGKENIGLKHAMQASSYIHSTVYYPVFDGLDFHGKPTDFNDLYVLFGKDITKKQLKVSRK
jgi:putative DNA primase/helicase